MNSTVGASSAIEAIRRRQAVRVYADTSGLKLLGIADKYAARIEWKQAHGRPVLPTEASALESAKREIERRTATEMEEARAEFARRNKIWSYFPDEGPLRRELYPRHMEFIEATKTSDEIGFCAGNRVGKSQLGALCVAHWATGRYPHWWHGRVFDEPIAIWICNKTAKDTRDINEAELLGPPGNEAERGTGMIPAHLIQKVTSKPGTPHAFEFINVEHVSGGTSLIGSKSYDQGREAFQGRGLSVIWDDEEVTEEIWDEQRLRVMTTGGLQCFTYTPIKGLTPMTMSFMEGAGMNIEQMRHGHDTSDLLEA